MGSITHLKSNDLLNVPAEDYVVLNKKDIKNISRELCRAHRDGSLSTETLQEIIEHLLACYIEQDLEEKFSAKQLIIDRKINKISRYRHDK